MKPSAFQYHRPQDVQEALDLLAAHDNAKLLAGGQSLVPMMNFRVVTPDHLIDLNRVKGLSGIEIADGRVRIGAMTRQRDIEFSEPLREACPLLYAALQNVGHRQTRNRGTIGGSLSHADPAAELPAVMTTLDAVVDIESRRGRRRLPISEFLQGLMTTALESDELLCAIEFACWPKGHGYGFQEMALRHGDFAIAGAGVLLTQSDGKIDRIAITLSGVLDHATRLKPLEDRLVGRVLDADALGEATAAVNELDDVLQDIHASADYRRHVAGALLGRALQKAGMRAGLRGAAE